MQGPHESGFNVHPGVRYVQTATVVSQLPVPMAGAKNGPRGRCERFRRHQQSSPGASSGAGPTAPINVDIATAGGGATAIALARDNPADVNKQFLRLSMACLFV